MKIHVEKDKVTILLLVTIWWICQFRPSCLPSFWTTSFWM